MTKKKTGYIKNTEQGCGPAKGTAGLSKSMRFTLIELLVVIAIISILASMLLPALKTARNRAMQHLCQTRLKNVGYCLTNYSQDNNNWCVPTYDGTDFWADIIIDSGYLENNFDVLVCPTYRTSSGGKYVGVYFDAVKTFGVTNQAGSTKNYLHIPSEVKNPSNTLLAADSLYVPISGSTYLQAYTVSPFPTRMVHTRHFNKANILFIDSHIESRGKGELSLDLANWGSYGNEY